MYSVLVVDTCCVVGSRRGVDPIRILNKDKRSGEATQEGFDQWIDRG